MKSFEVNTYFDLMTIRDLSELREKLGKIKHLALDMDGTIYKGTTLFPFTVPFLNNMKKMGIGYSFLTNNPSKSTADYLKHLKKMGIKATEEEMYTSAKATIDYLRINYPQVNRLFILGTPSMRDEFERSGFVSTADSSDDTPDAVVVGFDMSLVYSRLCRATWWIDKGLPYIATNPDKVCPTDQPVTLVDCGSICSCIEEAVGRRPDVIIGKPDSRMLEGILRRFKLLPEEIAMVGDRIYTDIQLARNAGTLGVLLLTGEAVPNDVKAAGFYPDIVTRDLSVLDEMIRETRETTVEIT